MDTEKLSLNPAKLHAALPTIINPVRVEQIKDSAGRKIIDNIKGVSSGNTKKRKNILYTGVGDKGTTSLYNGKKVTKSSPIIKALGAVDVLQKHIGLLHAWISSVRMFSKQRSISWPPAEYTAFTVVILCVGIGFMVVNKLMEMQEPLSNGTIAGIVFLFMVMIYFSVLWLWVAYKDFHRPKKRDTYVVDHELVSELKEFLVVICYDLYKMMCDIGIPAEEVNTNFLSGGSCSSSGESQTETLDRYTKVHFDKSQRIGEFEEFIKKMDKHIPEINHFVLPIGGIVAANCGVANSICRQVEQCVCETLIDHENRPKECVTPIVSYLNRLSSFLYTLEQFMRVSEGKNLVFTTQLDKSM